MCLFDYDVTPRGIGIIKNNGLTSPAYSLFVMKNGNSELEMKISKEADAEFWEMFGLGEDSERYMGGILE